MPKQVCIVNAHWNNRGDEAALRPIVDSILSNRPDVKLTIIFKDRKEIQQFPYEGRVKHFSVQYLPKDLQEIEEALNGFDKKETKLTEMIRIMCKQDLLIYSPGGAVISDRFWWTKQLEYLLPFMCAEKFHIPIVVAAPSMGPFDDNIEKNILRHRWLSVAEKICVREPISAGYLKRLKLDNVETTIDTAFYDEPDFLMAEKEWEKDTELSQFFSKYEKVVGMTLSDFSWNVEYMKKEGLIKKSEAIISDFINRLKAQGYGVLLIPQLFGNQNDFEYLCRYGNTNVHIMTDEKDTYYQQYVISKCYAVVGMRYHSCIFAAKMGVPFIAIGYEEKMYGFMENWGLQQYMIRLKEIDGENVAAAWDTLVKEYDNYQLALLQHKMQWRKLACKTIEMIMQYL